MTSLLVENGRALESRLDFSGPWRVLKANWWKVVLFAAELWSFLVYGEVEEVAYPAD